MRIGIDIMGGDYAPQKTVIGAIEAAKELGVDDKLVLIGDETSIITICNEHGADPSAFEIVHAPDVITMSDHPTKAFAGKENSSIVTGFKLLASKQIDSFASAGNTGAMMVGSMMVCKTIPGIIRPAISSILPKEDGGVGVILDVGINADCKPDVLQQFAVLGSIFAEHVYHISRPKVALMSIGEEPEKGNLVTKEAHQLLKATKGINFVGNVEGRDLFNDKADVIVCDGFTGNVILKEAESIYYLMRKRNISDPYFDRYDYENYGGTPVLGINSSVIIAHGISSAKAIKNMILLSKEVVEARLPERISTALNHAMIGGEQIQNNK
jgi:glycerol-3-phosphate acyltransferase PlsX